jgi:hypothetical protein
MAKIGYSRFTNDDIEVIAKSVVRIIRAGLAKHQDTSMPPIENLAAWATAARELGARLVRFFGKEGDGVGYCDPKHAIIYYDCLESDHDCIRYIAHELAHHVQIVMPRGMAPITGLERYDDNRQSVQHRVARRAEILLLGEKIVGEESLFFCPEKQT